MKKFLYTALGLLCVTLGYIGALLPILPTVPFLLLAAFFFARSSDRFKAWLESRKLYQRHLASIVERGSMSKALKLRVMLTGAAVLMAPFLLARHIHVKALIIGLLLVKYWLLLFKIKTYDAPAADRAGREQGK